MSVLNLPIVCVCVCVYIYIYAFSSSPLSISYLSDDSPYFCIRYFCFRSSRAACCFKNSRQSPNAHTHTLSLLAHTLTKVCVQHALMYTYLIYRGVYVLNNTAEPTTGRGGGVPTHILVHTRTPFGSHLNNFVILEPRN